MPTHAPSSSEPSAGALQIEDESSTVGKTGNPRRHRLIDLGAAVGVAALLFSGSTYFFNRHDQHRADLREARSELTDIIGRMDALSREYGALDPATDGQNASSQFAAGSLANSERLSLVVQAEHLMDDNPSIAAAADYLSLGFAHLNLGSLDNLYRARTLFARAEKLAEERGDRYLVTAALVNKGRAEYQLGNAVAGTRLFQRLINGAQSRAPLASDGLAPLEYQWLGAAMESNDCDLVAQVFRQVAATIPAAYLATPSSKIEQACGTRVSGS
jgi:hypothetical protein